MRASNRKTNFKEVKKPILIICEDRKSSVYYFRNKIKDLHINPVDVKVDGNSGSSPISVVNYAIQLKKEQKAKAKKNGTEEFGFIYCVMDVDDHPNLKNAIQKAKDNNLIPIISNQCFELWYLLHFIDYTTKELHRKDISKKIEPFLGKVYDKSDSQIYEILKSKGSEQNAIFLSKKLENSALEDSEERNPLRNPTTDVYILIEKLNTLSL